MRLGNLTVSMFSLLVFCALPHMSQASEEETCSYIQIPAIFASALELDGRIVCTSGYFHDQGQPVLHEKENPAREEYYDKVIILDSDDQMVSIQFDELQVGQLVTVKGIVSVPSKCWLPTKDEDEEMFICAPFKRPIDMNVLEINGGSELR